jgi:anti-anti-sigma regulatory factor
MAKISNDTVAYLNGDLTHSGVTHNIVNILAVSLQKIISGGDTNIHIDCNSVHIADICGLQLLYVWMQSARFRGVEPELVNLSASLQYSFEKMGFGCCFTGDSTHPETLALFSVC